MAEKRQWMGVVFHEELGPILAPMARHAHQLSVPGVGQDGSHRGPLEVGTKIGQLHRPQLVERVAVEEKRSAVRGQDVEGVDREREHRNRARLEQQPVTDF